MVQSHHNPVDKMSISYFEHHVMTPTAVIISGIPWSVFYNVIESMNAAQVGRSNLILI